MLSSVTNAPFSQRCQSILRTVAQKHKYTSKYWITMPQSRRTSNALVLPGQKPTDIHLDVEKVLPLKSLAPSVQKRILDEYPPFFGSGVGILSDRKKWKSVTADRLIRLLNAKDDDRALFIDVVIADQLEIKYTAKNVVDVRPASAVMVYNGDQLDDPYKGEPQKGVAFDAITGKRFAQPAHDILLGVGILRGYTSPMWVGEKQLKFLNIELRKGAEKEAVTAANMMGPIASLSVLPSECRKELLQELKKRPDAFGQDIFFIYNVNGWEATRSRVLVKHMAAIKDAQYPFHFVNIRDLALEKPKFQRALSVYLQRMTPIGPSILKQQVDEKTVRELPESGLAVQRKTVLDERQYYFSAEDATLRRYYNASCMTKPYLTVPSVRPIAVVNGKLVGRRDEAILRAFALKHKLSSPLWLTEHSARRLGVRIHPRHANSFVSIGAAAADDNPEVESHDGFYNIDDFPDPEEIQALFPKASKRVHFMLDSKWRPVLGKQRQDYLDSLKRPTPLWVSVNECLMSGFEPRKGAKTLLFPTKGRGRDATGTKLYNSQYTTDPVRVVGLSTMYLRPQGVSL